MPQASYNFRMGAITSQLSRSVGQLTEEEIIRRVTTSLGQACPPFPAGPGGDCAIFEETVARKFRVSTVDSVILGRHFDLSTAGALAGAKLVNRNLSDLAAAGAVPSDALLSLLVGPNVDSEWLEDFAHGVGKAAHKFGLHCVGGDICRVQAGTFAATLAVQGYAHRVLTRKTAKCGDVIFVTGKLGGSIYGHHLNFEPRLAEGKWLNAQSIVTACTDLSDGMAKDLHGLINTMQDAVIDLTSLPIADAAHQLSKADGKPAVEHALQDGEDYELLFTVDAQQADLLQANFTKQFSQTPLKSIGVVAEGTGLIKSRADGLVITSRGFGHFA
jgi:thiamine-monophosphate kinase